MLACYRRNYKTVRALSIIEECSYASPIYPSRKGYEICNGR